MTNQDTPKKSRAPRAVRLGTSEAKEGSKKPSAAQVEIAPKDTGFDPFSTPNDTSSKANSSGSQSTSDTSQNSTSAGLDESYTAPNKSRSFFSLTALFWGSISALVTLALGLWLDTLVRTLFERWQWMGWAGIALVGLLALTLIIFITREFLALRRLAKIDHLRGQVEKIKKKSDRKSSTQFANKLLSLYAKEPTLFRARHTLKQDLPHLFDSEDILAHTEQVLIAPIDARANHLVHRSAKRVALVTALSPRAIFDIAIVFIETVRLVRAISQTYGNRPGSFAMLKLSGHIAGHLAVTGGMAAGESLLQQIIGHGMAARLSAKLGEGLLNGILTARVGLATIALCRPMPFEHAPEPTLGAVIRALKDQSDQDEQSKG